MSAIDYDFLAEYIQDEWEKSRVRVIHQYVSDDKNRIIFEYTHEYSDGSIEDEITIIDLINFLYKKLKNLEDNE